MREMESRTSERDGEQDKGERWRAGQVREMESRTVREMEENEFTVQQCSQK